MKLKIKTMLENTLSGILVILGTVMVFATVRYRQNVYTDKRPFRLYRCCSESIIIFRFL